ncbi:MAG: hypothetical protein JSU63_14285 [Phycisphaerales bacterium]|nr:MAG: hypothetical protein JSU63_14285 [Phycisphaerales bacterium]
MAGSPRRQPWDYGCRQNLQAPEGRRTGAIATGMPVAPPGLGAVTVDFSTGSRPWLVSAAPSGAEPLNTYPDMGERMIDAQDDDYDHRLPTSKGGGAPTR